MRIRTKLAMVEKRMQLQDLGRDCPLCRCRPPEVRVHEAGQPLPPMRASPCPLCGKAPQQIVLQT